MNIGAVILSAYTKPHPERQRAGYALRAEVQNRHAIPAMIETRPAPVSVTSRRGWERLTADGAITHALVMQDDVIPCPAFGDHVRAAVESNPDNLLSFFYFRRKLGAATYEAGTHWITTQGGITAQALCAPVGLAREFLHWERRYILPIYPHDDGRWTLFCMATKRKCWVTMPSLVTHDAMLASSLGHWVARVQAIAVAGPEMIDWTKDLDAPAVDNAISLGPRSTVEWNRIKGLVR